MVITENEFKEWLQHPVTQEMKKALRAKCDGIMQEWAQGGFTRETCEATALKNAEMVGVVGAYEAVFDFTFLDIETELANGDEPIGATPPGASGAHQAV